MSGRLILSLPTPMVAEIFGVTPPVGSIRPSFKLVHDGIARMVCLDHRSGTTDRDRVLIYDAAGRSTPQAVRQAIERGGPANDARDLQVPTVKFSDLNGASSAELLNYRRGIVVTSGYYEWTIPNPSLPTSTNIQAVVRKDGRPMLLACLYDEACEQCPGADLQFSVVTVAAKGNATAPDSWRPAILQADEAAAWLGVSDVPYDAERLVTLLHAASDSLLQRCRVPDVAGKAANGGQGLLLLPDYKPAQLRAAI